MTVRIGTIKDFDEIWRLFLFAYEENAPFPLSEEKASWCIKRALQPEKIHPSDTGMRGVIGVIGEPGKLQGAAFITIASFWYTKHLHLEELVVLVDPDHRKSDHAKTLINWMKEQVEEVGLPLLTGILSNNRTEAKCRLYGRLLPKAGEFFLFRPKDDKIFHNLVASSSAEQTVNGLH